MNIQAIRHGEAWHNVLYGKLGKDAFGEFQDTTLTARGMAQAQMAKRDRPDLILVSPLMRTLQTAQIMFPNQHMIALDTLMEYPQSEHLSNKRSPKTLLQQLYPNVDFRFISEKPTWPVVDSDEHLQNQINTMTSFLKQRNERNITLVTHSSWIKFAKDGEVGDEMEELEHCLPYKLIL